MSLKGTEMSQEEYLSIKASMLEKQVAEQEKCCRRYAMQRNIAILLCLIIVFASMLFSLKPSSRCSDINGAVAQEGEKTAISFSEWTKRRVERNYVASVTSEKYHRITCEYADNILEENRVYYATAEEAEKSGKHPCSVCRP